MKPKRRTSYGVYDLSRQIARRVQREWEAVESPPLPQGHANILPFHPLGSPWPPPTRGRPAAA